MSVLEDTQGPYSLSIEGLWVRYRSEADAGWVLQDIDLQVAQGEFVVISGFSGVGKSTLLATINGVASKVFDAEIRGAVRVQGHDVAPMSIGQISQRVGTVLQDADAQIFNLQVDDEVAFGPENLGLDRLTIAERVQTYCDLMGLSPTQSIERLSGGQKQRLVIASVLAMEQEILLLDEPLANLDRDVAACLLAFLRDLTRQGKTVILVEHRLDVALPYATRLLWLEDGRIAQDLGQAQAVASYVSLFKGRQDGAQPLGKPLLRLSEAEIGYGQRSILKDLNLTLCQGEQVVILGENASGKTTLLRVLVGLISVWSGELWRASVLREHPLTSSGRCPFKKVGYVYQNPNYQLFMDTVYKEIDFQSESAENTRDFITLFGIEHLQEHHPLGLSEGQKRLVTIAAIAAMRPQVLLLDEPTVGQDYRGLGRLIQALDEMRRRYETAIIVATHDLRCADALGARVLWLQDGTLAQDGDHSLVGRYFQRHLMERERLTEGESRS
jgi:energy-coupling factor transport system ATP-binding protein